MTMYKFNKEPENFPIFSLSFPHSTLKFQHFHHSAFTKLNTGFYPFTMLFKQLNKFINGRFTIHAAFHHFLSFI